MRRIVRSNRIAPLNLHEIKSENVLRSCRSFREPQADPAASKYPSRRLKPFKGGHLEYCFAILPTTRRTSNATLFH